MKSFVGVSQTRIDEGAATLDMEDPIYDSDVEDRRDV